MKEHVRRLTEKDIPAFRQFCETHWGEKHPLIHFDEMFDYYYREKDAVNFVAAFSEEDILGVCGFLKTNGKKNPDVYISYILTKKDAPFGLGFRLLGEIEKITNCRSINCNNIRKNTAGLYEFLGYTVEDMEHYYRLNRQKKVYNLANITNCIIAEVEKCGAKVKRIDDCSQLADFDFDSYSEELPHKDAGYFRWRFFDYPWNRYEIYRLSGKEGEGLAVFRIFEHGRDRAVRLVDFVGERTLFRSIGELIDRVLRRHDAEFCDIFSFGVGQEEMKSAGMTKIEPNDENVIPLYLEPPLYENTDITIFMSKADGFWMFRADGDQDRPNI